METGFRNHFISYRSFISELRRLLKVSEITQNRSTVLSANKRETNPLHPETNKTDIQLGNVIIYMQEHLTEELNLDDLAGEIGLSKYQLIRRFRKEKGTTPWKFLITKRIEKVKELLEEGIPPGHAALEAGFFDQSHLHKVFKEVTGCTPKEYQEKNFKNKN